MSLASESVAYYGAPAASTATSSYQPAPVRVGFVVHAMHVAGAEVLVAETIRRLGSRIDPTVLCLDAVGPLGEALVREGVQVHAVNRRPGIDLGVVRRLARLVRARRLQVLHAHQYTPFFYGALAARLASLSTRVIFTEHGRHYPDVVSRKRRLANRLILSRLADRVTGVCEFSAAGLADRDGFDRSEIEIIGNGIDAARYERRCDRAGAKAALGLSTVRRHVVSIARLHPVKDHATLLRAFAGVAAQLDDVDLLLVGDGPLRGALEHEVGRMDLGSRVAFLGVRDDVPDILAASDVFVLPSLCEAASITLLEAMASGVPIVATDVGGTPEILRRDVDGVLTPRSDASAMAAAVARFLESPDEAAEMARRAAARVRTTYRLDETIDRYLSMYRTLAGGGLAA
jgi:L-malate glycosyltransferase